jgi:hypothetical protein
VAIEQIDPALEAFESLKDAIASMDDVIVNRQEHDRRVGDDASIPAGVHGQIALLMLAG